jgi:dTDP-4-amino-4,6-dideoxygalactose transaminase
MTTRIDVMVPWLGQEEVDAVAEAIASGWVAQGPRVARFEREFAEAMQAPFGVATTSCTTALHLALVVAGIGPGDHVVVPSFSFIATTNAVRYVGAEPVFADVDPVTGNLTGETVWHPRRRGSARRRRDRGCGVRRGLHLQGAAGRRRRRHRRMVVPSAQAPHHR